VPQKHKVSEEKKELRKKETTNAQRNRKTGVQILSGPFLKSLI